MTASRGAPDGDGAGRKRAKLEPAGADTDAAAADHPLARTGASADPARTDGAHGTTPRELMGIRTLNCWMWKLKP
jgi:hypothetical protein